MGDNAYILPYHYVYSITRYLQYVSSEDMVYLRDSSDMVISLPPLTNSHNTKVCTVCLTTSMQNELYEHLQVAEDTTELFVEVTSSESLAAAKIVMDALVTGVVVMGEGGRGGEGGVRVEQVRVVDGAGQLLVLYPSRTDLVTSTDVTVVRPD